LVNLTVANRFAAYFSSESVSRLAMLSSFQVGRYEGGFHVALIKSIVESDIWGRTYLVFVSAVVSVHYGRRGVPQTLVDW